MSAKKPEIIRLGNWNAQAERQRISEAGTREWYWVLRIRRDGRQEKRALGWCHGPAEATERALDAIQVLREAERSRFAADGSAHLTSSIEAYHEAVPHIPGLRPNTIRLRQFASRNLLEWATSDFPTLRCSQLEKRHGHSYAAWLVERGYARSTVNRCSFPHSRSGEEEAPDPVLGGDPGSDPMCRPAARLTPHGDGLHRGPRR
ncbi:MAG: hypothetical protein H6737_11045 [Alphaproteobacteria bacterium]|nr:hypothetical protein [Alphaproteobacteria bacterium]